MFYSGRQMRRKAIGLQSASPLQYCNGLPIATRFALCALTEAQSEKLPWVEAIAAELSPAKAYPAKSVVLSQGTDISGVDTRSPRRPAERLGDICAKCDAPDQRGQCDHGIRWGLRLAHDTGSAGKRDCNRGSGFPLGVTLTGGRIASGSYLKEFSA